jgi:hypothetical protein
MPKVYTPSLRAVKYLGDTPRKIWEAGLVESPTIQKGEVVIVPLVAAKLMVTKKDFEYFQGNTSFITVKSVKNEEPQAQTTQAQQPVQTAAAPVPENNNGVVAQVTSFVAGIAGAFSGTANTDTKESE